jgi:predicted PurR-regulated permease PerM
MPPTVEARVQPAETASAGCTTKAVNPDAALLARRWFELGVLLLVTALVLLTCYLMLQPFLGAMTTAIAMAVVLLPFQRELECRRINGSIAALMTVVVGLAILGGPIFLVVARLADEFNVVSDTLAQLARNGTWDSYLAAYPGMARLVQWVSTHIDIARIASNATGTISGWATSFVQASGAQIISLVIAVYFLFFALRDRRIVLSWVTRLSPLPAPAMRDLTGRIATTIRATLFGTVCVSLLQGMLGGLMFFWLGLPAPLLWGLVMGVAAMLPVIGTFIVWLPTAIYLLATGQTLEGVILLCWGLFVVGLIDNLLYPVFVGGRTQTHTIPTFFSLVGGIFVFGPAGLIIGPVVFAIAIFLLEYWRHDSVIPVS